MSSTIPTRGHPSEAFPDSGKAPVKCYRRNFNFLKPSLIAKATGPPKPPAGLGWEGTSNTCHPEPRGTRPDHFRGLERARKADFWLFLRFRNSGSYLNPKYFPSTRTGQDVMPMCYPTRPNSGGPVRMLSGTRKDPGKS